MKNVFIHCFTAALLNHSLSQPPDSERYTLMNERASLVKDTPSNM